MRMRHVTCILLLAAAPLSAQTASPAEREILAVVHSVFDGMRKGDSAMVRAAFHPRARMITMAEGRPLRIEESANGFISMVGQPRTEVFDEQVSNVRVLVDGAMASVWTDYRFFRGTTFSHCGVNHFLLVRDGSAWQIIELSDTRRREPC